MQNFLNKQIIKTKLIWIFGISFLPAFSLCFFFWLHFFLNFPPNTIINHGGIGGLGSDNITLVIILQSAVLLLFPVLFIFCTNKAAMIGSGIVFAGALMNWMDRFIYKTEPRFNEYKIALGGVIDYIQIGKTTLYANVPDICVIVGLLLYVVAFFSTLPEEDDKKDKKQDSKAVVKKNNVPIKKPKQ